MAPGDSVAIRQCWTLKTFFDGTDKLQSSWSRFIFGATEADAFIHGFSVFAGELHLVIERADGFIYLEHMSIEREVLATGMDYMPHLDQRTTATGAYNAEHDTTIWELPWQHAEDARIVMGGAASVPGETPTTFFTDNIRLTLASVAIGETLVFDGKTFQAHASTTTPSLRTFSVAGTDTQDATELYTVLTDATYGITDNWAVTDNGDGTLDINPLDAVDGTLATTDFTGTAVDNATITRAAVPILVACRGDYSAAAAYIGRTYTMLVELSRIYPQENETPIVTGRLQLQDISTLFENTGYFELKITPDGGREATRRRPSTGAPSNPAGSSATRRSCPAVTR